VGQGQCTASLTGWRGTRRAAAGREGLAGPQDARDARGQGCSRHLSYVRSLTVRSCEQGEVLKGLRPIRVGSPMPQSAITEYIGPVKVGVTADETSSPAGAPR